MLFNTGVLTGIEVREGTAEQNSPALAFFHDLVTWTEMGQQEQMQVFSTPVPDGNTGILFCAPLLGRTGFPTSICGCPKGRIPNCSHCSLSPFTCRDVVGGTCSHDYLFGAQQTKRWEREKKEPWIGREADEKVRKLRHKSYGSGIFKIITIWCSKISSANTVLGWIYLDQLLLLVNEQYRCEVGLCRLCVLTLWMDLVFQLPKARQNSGRCRAKEGQFCGSHCYQAQ